MGNEILMEDLSTYMTEDTFNNINNNYSNVYGVLSNIELEVHGKGIGTIVLFINLKKKAYYKYGDIITFNKSKIQYKSSYIDKEGCRIYLVNPYFCKAYNHDVKIPCEVEVLKTVEDNGVRRYFKGTEKILLTRKEYVKRYNIELFGDVKYRVISACQNMWERINIHKNYYKALNETAKHYLIEHEHLKTYYAKYKNGAGVAVRRWDKFKVDYYTQNQNQKVLQDKLDDLKSKSKTNVINFKSKTS